MVGSGDRICFIGEAIQRDHRPEGLFTEALHLGVDPFKDGRLIEVGAQVRACPTTGEHCGPLGLGIFDVLGHRLQLGGAGQGAHVIAPVESGAQRHRLDRCHELFLEPVIDRIGDVHPLGGDTKLSSVGEGGAHRAFHCPIDVGITQDQDWVLAAELQGAADQPIGTALGDDLAGGRGAGEADVVGPADHLRADLGAGTGHGLPQILGETGLLEQACTDQGGEHRLRVRLDHHGIAGCDRGNAIAQSQREWIVPRSDDAHDTLGHMVDLHLSQPWHSPDCLVGAHDLLGALAVVARRQRYVKRLIVGMLARFAGLPDDHIHDLGLMLHHQIVQAQ